jgi:glycerophosphoryl diester phosphodiesterase
MTPALPPYDLPLVVAHRGGALLRAENSASAFRFSISSGIRALETDLQMSRDGVIFCWHDHDLSRIGFPGVTVWESQSQWLEGLALDSLGPLDRPGEPLLKLDDLLSIVGHKPVHLFLELKSPPESASEGIRERLLEHFLSALDQTPCGATVISSDTIFLRMIRLKRPDIPIVHLVDSSGPTSAFPRWGCALGQNWQGEKDIVYTCKNVKDYLRAHQSGANIWMCDHPLEARRWHP